MNLANKRILVIGGAGFIGSHLVDSLAEKSPSALYIVDNLFLGSRKNLVQARKKYPSLRFYKKDATNSKWLRGFIRQEKISVVFNLATKALGYSFDDPEDAFHVNTKIASCLLESLRLKEINYLIHFSSSEAYGTAAKVPMSEDHPLLPHTPYAAGKAAADLLINAYQKTFGLRILILRPFNNYGPRQNKGSYAGVVPITITKLLDGEPPVINGNGKQTRDFIFVRDTARLAVMLAEREELYGKVINLGTGTEVTVRDIVKNICNISGYCGDIKKAPCRPGDVLRHRADINILLSTVENPSLQSLEKGLFETFEWYFQTAAKITFSKTKKSIEIK